MQYSTGNTGYRDYYCTALNARLVGRRADPQLVSGIKIMAVNPVEYQHYNRQEDKGHPYAGELRNNKDQRNGERGQHTDRIHSKLALPALRSGFVPVHHHSKLG
ncbi:hypothetical protein D3C80_1538940 [compost metagenome]